MIAKRLFLNHSPSEWFSFIQEAVRRVLRTAMNQKGGFPDRRAGHAPLWRMKPEEFRA